MTLRNFGLLINGRIEAGANFTPVINPATGALLVDCPRASVEQAAAAVEAAKAAFPSWSNQPVEVRRSALVSIADRIKANDEELTHLLVLEQGKPLAEAAAEVLYTELFFRAFAEFSLDDRLIEESENRRVILKRQALGPVAAIVPWNFPLLLAASKIAPALLAGNTVILKPAPTTPLTSLMLGEICANLVPAGVFNVIADQNDLGDFLTRHPDVRKVAFTGSTETGRKVMANSAQTIKRVTLELGGNDPAIVLPAANIRATAAGIFATAFANCGQVCMAIKRVYAHDTIYDELCRELAQLADAAVVGDGLAEGTQIGPLQNDAQFSKLKSYLLSIGNDGCIIAGGEIVDRPGYFMRPTIVRDIHDGHPLVDEEQFGPILPIIRYSDPMDAVQRANASNLGLGASVWGPVEQALELGAKLEAGNVWINKHMDFGPTIPFAGAKQSGIGVELAVEGLDEYTQIQVLNQAV
jgi:acyl-CoA reductase-like NAD-dependent aldehyde dehydrogenase